MQKACHHSSSDEKHRDFLIGLARASAGALIFSIPMLMTMEMWWLGFYMDSHRLAVFVVVNVLLLIGLARYRGFRHDIGWYAIIIDAFVGYLIGFATAAVFLPLLGVIEFDMSLNEIIGKITIQAIPASMGALLARGQLGSRKKNEDDLRDPGYFHEIFIMITGALFVGLNTAPTEEILLIAYKINPWIALVLMAACLIIIHIFVYNVDFHGQESMPQGSSMAKAVVNYSVTGYAVVLLTSLFLLWIFGRLEGQGYSSAMMVIIVLSLPGAIGAAAARLIL